MNQTQMRKMCQKQIDDVVDRMHYLCADGRSDDAAALYAEIQDWVVKKTEIDVMTLDYLEDMFHND